MCLDCSGDGLASLGGTGPDRAAPRRIHHGGEMVDGFSGEIMKKARKEENGRWKRIRLPKNREEQARATPR